MPDVLSKEGSRQRLKSVLYMHRCTCMYLEITEDRRDVFPHSRL